MKWLQHPLGVFEILFLMILGTGCQPAVHPLTTVPILTPTSTTLLNVSTLTATPTPIPTETTYPTLTPTLTSTPQPLLAEHTWQPETVLIRFDDSCGDCGGDITAPDLPILILYADGSLFLLNTETTKDGYDTKILYKKLNRKEICQHLNTFEQIGYFNYDPLRYEFIGGHPAVSGAYGNITLEINAWQSRRDDYYELGFFLHDELTGDFAKEKQQQGVEPSKREGWPVITPELRNAFYFLSDYPVVNFRVYQPERLGIWMFPVDQEYLPNYTDHINPIKWTLKKPSLAKLSENIDPFGKSANTYTILTGSEARTVYNYLGQSYTSGLFYEENSNGDKQYYLLLDRPFLPYELLDNSFSQIPAPDTQKPSFNLTCYPSDGVLPIPTTSIP